MPPAAAFTNHSNLLAVAAAQALADRHRRRRVRRGAIRDPNASAVFRTFAAAVPMTYCGVYLVVTLRGGLWWDWNIALGAWLWSGVVGYVLSLLASARRA